LSEYTQQSPVFIGGTGRSGTTLLTRILDLHPAIAAIKWESHFMVDKDGLPGIIDHGKQALPAFMEQMKGPWWNRKIHNLNSKPYRAGLADDISESVFLKALETFEKAILNSENRDDRLEISRNFINTIITGFLAGKKKVRWAEKTPQNSIMVDSLLELFPEAKFINVIRDGRDVVVSMVGRQIWPIPDNTRITKVRKKRRVTVKNASIYWREYLSFALNLVSTYPEHCLNVRFESLLQEPQKELARIAAFLGEEPSPDWNTCQLHLENTGLWKKCFSPDIKKTFKKHAGKLLIETGYEKNDNW